MPQPISSDTQTSVTKQLRAAGSVFAEAEATLLITESKSEQDLKLMVAERITGTPIEQILGWAEFCGHRIKIGPNVFVPRHRSEFLVQKAIELTRPGDTVLDLCCGSGALGFALQAVVPDIRLYASDIEAPSVACARRNLEPIGGTVVQGNLFDGLPTELRGHINTLLVNAPYVPTDEIRFMPAEARLYEPLVTLDGGKDGLDIHRRVADGAVDWLTSQGKLCIETSQQQFEETAAIMAQAGLIPTVLYDNDFDATIVIATKP